MNRHLQNIKITTLIGFLILSVGCKKEADPVAATPDAGSTLFTASDITKTWNSGCLTGTDPITGGNRYKHTLNLYAGGNFSYDITYYTGGACTGANYLAIYNSTGTFTVGGATTGGQTLDFIVTSSDVMPMVTAAQAPLYSDCGATLTDMNAPHNNLSAPAVGYNGHHFDTYMALCMSTIFPNSSNKNITNVGTYSNSVLTIGLPYGGIPGVFVGNAVPTSATVQLF